MTKGKNKSKDKDLNLARRRTYQNIMLIHMMTEQNGGSPPEKQMDLWLRGEHFFVAKWEGQSFMNVPKTLTQLRFEVKKRGYPGVRKDTIKQCLDELIDLHVLLRFSRTGTDRKYNRIFYALPWAIDDGPYYQHRRYYIPWPLTVTQKQQHSPSS